MEEKVKNSWMLMVASKKEIRLIDDNTFYDWIYGVFCTWMLTLSSYMLYYQYWKQPSATERPYIYWTVFAWTITPLWFFSWALWIINRVWGNDGGSLHYFFAYTSVAYYMVLPVLI
jgi:hypothetical protein